MFLVHLIFPDLFEKKQPKLYEYHVRIQRVHVCTWWWDLSLSRERSLGIIQHSNTHHKIINKQLKLFVKVGVNPSLKKEMWLLMHLITKKTCTKMYKSIHFWNQKSQMNAMVATDFCKIMRFSRNSSVTMVTIEFFLDSITKIWFY